MGTWIAFLRAINLGPRRKYPMAELREALTLGGFAGVETHIQTGNVRLRTPLRARHRVATELERVMLADRGFEVPAVVLTPAEVAALAQEAAALGEGRPEGIHAYVVLLADEVDAETRTRLEERSGRGEDVVVSAGGRAVRLLPDAGYRSLHTDHSHVERIAGCAATARNHTVLAAVATKWGTSPRSGA